MSGGKYFTDISDNVDVEYTSKLGLHRKRPSVLRREVKTSIFSGLVDNLATKDIPSVHHIITAVSTTICTIFRPELFDWGRPGH